MVTPPTAEKHTFQAEIKRLLDILVHSLYTDRDIFLRELISNSSDALSKLQFQRLTDDNIRDADAELFIELHTDPDAKQIRIVDSGLGMTHDELIQNLGVIAQSGAASFVERMKDAENASAADLIGQFGVGFYSVFMVAERVEVTSLSYQPDAEAYTWISAGEDTYELVPAEKTTRGTEILVQLREDAAEYTNAWKLRQIIKEHSDYISFPIYIIDGAKQDDESEEEEDQAPTREAINQQTAIWRRSPDEIEQDEYTAYFRQLTLDFDDPILTIHARGDAPIQYYALLYIPAKAEQNMLSPRKQPGLKLYTRKVLIQDYNTDLLPDYLHFVQGVVDSEDLPLNVSRESIQANPMLAKLKQVVTRKILTELKKLANNEPERYAGIWREYGAFLKHGLVSEFSDRERLLPLLRFHSSTSPDALTTLADYVERMESVHSQEAIYYLAADNVAAAARSPHLEPFRARGIEVLYMTDNVDGFLVNALGEYEGHKLVSADSATLDLENVGELSEDEQPDPQDDDVQVDALDQLLVRARNTLGEVVESVRLSKVMTSASPVRLVAPEGAIDRHTQRVYQMLERDFETPARILEINPRHPIIRNLARRLQHGLADDAMVDNSLHLLYNNALLADGIHPNPAEMALQIQQMMALATQLHDDDSQHDDDPQHDDAE